MCTDSEVNHVETINVNSHTDACLQAEIIGGAAIYGALGSNIARDRSSSGVCRKALSFAYELFFTGPRSRRSHRPYRRFIGLWPNVIFFPPLIFTGAKVRNI